MDIFNFILIIVSLGFLIYSVFMCRKMITTLTRPYQRRAGHIMMALIVIFFLSYVGYLAFSYDMLYSSFLSSMIFFFTAFFVMLVLQVNHSLIIRLTLRTLELKEFSQQLFKESEALTSSKERLEKIKGLLEKKNSEMGDALKKWSAWRIAIMKRLETQQKQKQQEQKEQQVQGSEKAEEKKPAESE